MRNCPGSFPSDSDFSSWEASSTDSMNLNNDNTDVSSRREYEGGGDRQTRNSLYGILNHHRSSFVGSAPNPSSHSVYSATSDSTRINCIDQDPGSISIIQEFINGFLKASDFQAAELWSNSTLTDSTLKQYCCAVTEEGLASMVEQNRNDMTRHEEKETGLFAKVAKKREALWESGIGERRDDDKEKNFVTIERAKKSGIQTIMAIPWQDSFYSPLFLFR